MINDSCVASYGWTYVQNFSLFTDRELIDYCRSYDSASRTFDGYDKIVVYSMMVTGALGLVNNALMLATFQRSLCFAGPTFAYHKAVCYAELLHMIIMLQYAVIRYLHFPGSNYFMVLWRDCLWVGWPFGDSAKLFISCVISCVSLERTVAVWFPNQFRRINNRRTVVLCLAISFVVSVLHILPAAGYAIVADGNGQYHQVPTAFGLANGQVNVSRVIYIVKIVQAVVISAASVAVGVGVRSYSRRMTSFSAISAASASASAPPPMSAAGGAKRWTVIRRASQLQLIAAVTILFDYAAWVAFKLVADQNNPNYIGLDAVFRLTYADAVTQLDGKRLENALELFQVLTGELDHGARLYIYLGFHQSFRNSFRRMFSRSVTPTVAAQTVN